ncbi:hypothetical protein [Arthrobacter sp. YN]|uniref:hypothetical protein n=1 Tax=Arthrobacter sp. YN TaxID=2020486 RepID=UPI0012FD2A39|nr:hypothetical protein [Arthrobacter sp. YN]
MAFDWKAGSGVVGCAAFSAPAPCPDVQAGCCWVALASLWSLVVSRGSDGSRSSGAVPCAGFSVMGLPFVLVSNNYGPNNWNKSGRSLGAS